MGNENRERLMTVLTFIMVRTGKMTSREDREGTSDLIESLHSSGADFDVSLVTLGAVAVQ
jgi:hypothetical protein